MKKETLQKRTKIANDIMYYIYTHIETNIDIEELSIDLKKILFFSAEDYLTLPSGSPSTFIIF